jgi:adenylosuccinate synthase
MNQTVQNVAVIGAQWGDEGKGKIVDLLCEDFDVVARYQGGHNAGHTVRFGDKHYSLHLVPSGILHESKLCILGNGMVIDPRALLSEVEKLRSVGVVIGSNLRISEAAHCILPFHSILDLAREEAAGEGKIGTTGRGIGPAYEMKASRYGVQIGDLLDRGILVGKLRWALAEKNALLTSVYGREEFDIEKIADEYTRLGDIFRDSIEDTTLLVNAQIRAGRRVMFEGAQGAMLDIDHGSYPFVTSSSCVAGGICTGLGVAPKHVHSVVGVAKAYTTRVGGGPFPTELHDETGDRIRTRGNEFGTTTGRPRRIGWLDLPVLRAAAMLNGLDSIALTKLDVLDDLPEIPVCTGYRIGGEVRRDFARREVALDRCEPVYEVLPGWQQSTVGIRSFEELPEKAKAYVRFIEEQLEVTIGIVSTGPRREETILR